MDGCKIVGPKAVSAGVTGLTKQGRHIHTHAVLCAGQLLICADLWLVPVILVLILAYVSSFPPSLPPPLRLLLSLANVSFALSDEPAARTADEIGRVPCAERDNEREAGRRRNRSLFRREEGVFF